MKTRTMVICAAMLLTLSVHAEARDWKLRDGQTIAGDFDGVEGTNVRIRNGQGVVVVSYGELNDASQGFVMGTLEARGDKAAMDRLREEAPREWTDTRGAKLTARYVRVEGDRVLLAAIGDAQRFYEFLRFSEPDRDYIRSVAEKRGEADGLPDKEDEKDDLGDSPKPDEGLDAPTLMDDDGDIPGVDGDGGGGGGGIPANGGEVLPDNSYPGFNDNDPRDPNDPTRGNGGGGGNFGGGDFGGGAPPMRRGGNDFGGGNPGGVPQPEAGNGNFGAARANNPFGVGNAGIGGSGVADPVAAGADAGGGPVNAGGGGFAGGGAPADFGGGNNAAPADLGAGAEFGAGKEAAGKEEAKEEDPFEPMVCDKCGHAADADQKPGEPCRYCSESGFSLSSGAMMILFAVLIAIVGGAIGWFARPRVATAGMDDGDDEY